MRSGELSRELRGDNGSESEQSHLNDSQNIVARTHVQFLQNHYKCVYKVHLLSNLLSASEEKLVSRSVMLSRKFANLESCRGIDVDAKV